MNLLGWVPIEKLRNKGAKNRLGDVPCWVWCWGQGRGIAIDEQEILKGTVLQLDGCEILFTKLGYRD